MDLLDRFRRLAEIDIMGGLDFEEDEEFENILLALVGQGIDEGLLYRLWDASYDESIFEQIKGELQ